MGFRLLLPHFRRWMRAGTAQQNWRDDGRARPPPAEFKRAFLQECGRKHQVRILVETGTFCGDTLEALRESFDQLHSIELDELLFKRATERFSGDHKIRLWHGDSATILPHVLSGIHQPILFWLDGHYSGEGTARAEADTPIRQELHHIGQHCICRSHLVVIDDARLFEGTNGYPTLGDLRVAAAHIGFNDFKIEHDMIVLSSVARK